MKVTKTQLRKIVREVLSEGFTDDVKKFKEDYGKTHGKLKEKAVKLREKQQIMKAVNIVNEKITEMLAELKKLPVTEVLENVKKSNANKYTRAIETLSSICEHSTGWLKENK
jgi:uncharacterized protein YwgA